MTIDNFPANPYALLTNGVVTDVIYMQNYDADEIAETLLKYKYEEVICCSEHGEMLYIGWMRLGEWIVSPAPHPLWVFNYTFGLWEPPSNWNPSMVGWFSACRECDEEDKSYTSYKEIERDLGDIYAN